MKTKINRVCESFNAKKFDIPKDDVTLKVKIENLDSKLNEI